MIVMAVPVAPHILPAIGNVIAEPKIPLLETRSPS